MYKILIIEDDEIIVQIVKRHLESWGYEVFQIEDFTHVIQEFVQKDPQLVLNIINLRKKWKGICSQVPFIVLKYRQGCI